MHVTNCFARLEYFIKKACESSNHQIIFIILAFVNFFNAFRLFCCVIYFKCNLSLFNKQFHLNTLYPKKISHKNKARIN